MRRLTLVFLAAVALAQSPPAAVVFNVDTFPSFKSMAIGDAHCDFWSNLTGRVYALESACYASATAKPQIAVYNPTEIALGGFAYCADGNILPAASSPVATPNCSPGVAGGTFTWLLSPSGTAGVMAYHFAAVPASGTGASKDGTF